MVDVHVFFSSFLNGLTRLINSISLYMKVCLAIQFPLFLDFRRSLDGDKNEQNGH